MARDSLARGRRLLGGACLASSGRAAGVADPSQVAWASVVRIGRSVGCALHDPADRVPMDESAVSLVPSLDPAGPPAGSDELAMWQWLGTFRGAVALALRAIHER